MVNVYNIGIERLRQVNHKLVPGYKTRTHLIKQTKSGREAGRGEEKPECNLTGSWGLCVQGLRVGNSKRAQPVVGGANFLEFVSSSFLGPSQWWSTRYCLIHTTGEREQYWNKPRISVLKQITTTTNKQTNKLTEKKSLHWNLTRYPFQKRRHFSTP